MAASESSKPTPDDITALLDEPYAARQYVLFVEEEASDEAGPSSMAWLWAMPPPSLPQLTRILAEYISERIQEARDKGIDIVPIPWRVASAFTLPPGHPRKEHLYVAHPTNNRYYLPAADFHRLVFEHKFAEAIRLLMHLGAKTIDVSHQQGWDHRFASKLTAGIPQADVSAKATAERSKTGDRHFLYHADLDGHANPTVPEDAVWYPHEPTWQSVAEGRIQFGLKKFSLKLQYTDDYGVNADFAVDVQNAGLSLGGEFEKHQKTVWALEGEFG